MAKKKKRKIERARDAITGRFVSLADAQARPANTVFEHPRQAKVIH